MVSASVLPSHFYVLGFFQSALRRPSMGSYLQRKGAMTATGFYRIGNNVRSCLEVWGGVICGNPFAFQSFVNSAMVAGPCPA